MPSNWIRERGELRRFQIRETGLGVSALKLYLALAAATVAKECSRGDLPGVVSLSYSELHPCSVRRGGPSRK